MAKAFTMEVQTSTACNEARPRWRPER